MDRLKELAVEFASGTLEGSEEQEFRALLRSAPSAAKAEAAAIIDAAAVVALTLPRTNPSASLKGKILLGIEPPKETPELFEFVADTGDTGWMPMRVPGAFVKLLSLQKEKGYAVVLGKLDPKTYYPPHSHIGPEQIFVLSGDLHIGQAKLKPGDFHNAKAGSSHGVNYSETGCTIIAIVAIEDLATLMPA